MSDNVEYDDNGDETDGSLRTRIFNAYGMWGAFLTAVLESSGQHLDDCAKHTGLTRRRR